MKAPRPSDHPTDSPILGSRPPRKRRAAFTLIELLAIMVVITLVAAFTVPELISTSSARKVEQAQNMVAGAMDNARLMAIADGSPRALFIPTQANSMISTTLGGTPVGLQTFVVLRKDGLSWEIDSDWQSLPEGVAFENATNFDATFVPTKKGLYDGDNPMLANLLTVDLDLDQDGDFSEADETGIQGGSVQFFGDGSASKTKADNSKINFWVFGLGDALVAGNEDDYNAKNVDLIRYVVVEAPTGSITTPLITP